MHRLTTASLRGALLPLLLVLGALVAHADEEILRDFKRYFRQFKTTPERVEAVLALEGTEATGVVDVLVPVLGDEDPQVAASAVRVLGSFKTPEPQAAVFAALDSQKKEQRRVGLLLAIAVGGYDGPLEVLVDCSEDRSWPVRWRAIEALAGRGGEEARAAVLVACVDKEPAVRSAALEGLAAMSAREVVEPAIVALDDEVWQVRSSAAVALTKVRDKRAIAPLIAHMETEEGRLLADYGSALEEITGKTFGQRAELWRQFWDAYSERFVIPTDEELATMKAKRAAAREKYNPPGAIAYHGVDTPSRSIVFVVDVSGSMENLVVDQERFKDGKYPSMARIDIVKTELARTIDALEPYVRFNVIAFATDVDPWRKKLAPANALNKKSAHDWALKLEAIGGNSKEDFANAGLVQTANLEGGRTNTFGGLMRAFDIDPKKSIEDDYQTEVDTIFFLSDGRPTVGDLIDPDDILKEIARINALRKVVLNTIALGEFRKDFMQRLAEQNGGTFVDLGH